MSTVAQDTPTGAPSLTSSAPAPTCEALKANTPTWYTNLKKGSILYFPTTRAISVVNRIDENSNVYIVKPQYSVNSEPGTWSLYGDKVVYESYMATNIESLLTPPHREEEREEEPIVNPSGILIRKQVFNDQCPWGNCGGGLFCPGCGGVSRVFDYLRMSCGVLMACPVCHGAEFAEQDKRYLRDLEYENYSKEDDARIWRQRCDLVDKRREQLGLPPIPSWD